MNTDLLIPGLEFGKIEEHILLYQNSMPSSTNVSDIFRQREREKKRQEVGMVRVSMRRRRKGMEKKGERGE